MATKKSATVIKKTKKIDKSEGVCFVIMPFGGWFDSYYADIYCPAIIKAGFTHRRADDLFRPSNIVQDIWELTKKAKIILADLTNKNPNVFYELGLAHALAKPVILITQTIDDIPFDLRSLRIIEYDKNEPNWSIKLQGKIEKAIKETIASPNETIPTAFLESKRSDVSIPQLTKHEKDLVEVKQELELIKRQISRSTSYSSPTVTREMSLFQRIRKRIEELAISGHNKTDIQKKIMAEFELTFEAAETLTDNYSQHLSF